MKKLLVVSQQESNLSALLAASFGACDLIRFDALFDTDLNTYDAFALLGGTEAESIALLPPIRFAVEQQIALGKKVFCEFVHGIAQTSFLEIQSTRYERPVLIHAGEITGTLKEGVILDEQSNNRMVVYKATNRETPILQYVKLPRGFYSVEDPSAIENDFSAYALWQELPNLMISAFRMANFAKAKFAPRAAWAQLICGLVCWLGGCCTPEQVQQVLDADYSFTGAQPLRQAVDHATQWYEQAGMFVHLRGAPYAVLEGLNSHVLADGTRIVSKAIRNDNTGETAYMYYLRSLLSQDPEDRKISDGLYRMPLDMQITDDCPHQGMVRGCIRGWWQVSYQDDTARGFLLPLMWRAFLSGDMSLLPRVRLTLDYLLRGTGTDGLRPARLDFYDQNSSDVSYMNLERADRPDGSWKWEYGGGSSTLERLHDEPCDTPSAHYNAYYLASLLLGYRLTGEKKYLDAGVRGLESIMAVYPLTAREHSQTQEMCRLMLPLALLYWVSEDDRHRGWLYQVTKDLQKVRHRNGGYIEWDTGYIACCAGVEEGESSVLARNGDPVMDLLYSVNWLPHSLILAYYITSDSQFRQLWQELAHFLASIQISSPDKMIDGVWPRAIDLEQREVYGVPNDTGWAPWSVETGWTIAEISSGILLGLLEDQIKDRFRQHA